MVGVAVFVSMVNNEGVTAMMFEDLRRMLQQQLPLSKAGLQQQPLTLGGRWIALASTNPSSGRPKVT